MTSLIKVIKRNSDYTSSVQQTVSEEINTYIKKLLMLCKYRMKPLLFVMGGNRPDQLLFHSHCKN